MLLHVFRFFIRIFSLFPVCKNKVVLQSFNGRLYNCNPKYITESLAKTERYKLYFALNRGVEPSLPAGVKRLTYRSVLHFYHLMTAGFVIFNSTGITGYLPFRKSQTVIQTWHGAYSFKVIGNDFNHDEKARKRRLLSGTQIDYFLSGSQLASEQHSRAMCVSRDKFLEIGLPRNDILFRDQNAIRNKVHTHFGLPDDIKFVLYAPTFRDGPVKSMSGYGLPPIDPVSVMKALEERFGGKFVFLYKAHHNMIPTNIGADCINASDYTDIQELLCASAVLLTDYSSCMADFAQQKRPGFLYAPDLEDYISAHPVSMDPALWPYQIAHTNEELIRNIRSYDEQAGLERIEGFFSRIGNCEDGHAMEKLLHHMDEKLKQ